eukprot:g638.t1
MATACATASSEDQEAKLKALLAFGHKVHELQHSMDDCAPEFFFAVCSAGANQERLRHRAGNLKLYWQALGSNAEALHQRLGAMCDLMRSRIMTSYEENPEKRPNLVKFSAAFDTAINGLAGAGEADLTARLKEMGE